MSHPQQYRIRSHLSRAFVLACVLFFFGPVTARSEQSVTLRFDDSALVNDTIVRLGDVATVNGDVSGELLNELRTVSLGAVAPAGFSRFVGVSDLVSYRLRSQFPGVSFSVQGPARVEIRTDFTERRLTEYLPDVVNYLASEIGWNTGDWSVSFEDTSATWKTLRGSVETEIKGLQSRYPKGNITLSLLMKQGSRVRRIPILCRLRVETPVLVARQTINRGEAISADDIELRRTDITRLGPSPFTDVLQIQGLLALRTIDAGTILHERMMKAEPLIYKGDQVYIGLRAGTVRVSVPAIARESGKLGDKIWVENALTHKLVRVTVRGKGSVSALQGGENI